MKSLHVRILGICIVSFIILTSLVSHSATITVTNTNIEGPGSLLEAVTQIAGHGDRIVFNIPLPNRIISYGFPINKNISIEGPGSDKLIIETFISLNPVFEITSFGGPSVRASISGLTVSSGNFGISNHQTLIINDVVLKGNDVGIAHWGGGSLEINNSEISLSEFDGLQNVNFSDKPGSLENGVIIRSSVITQNGNNSNGFGLINVGGLSNSLPYGAYTEIYDSEISSNTDAGILNLAGEEDYERTEGGEVYVYNSSISSNGTSGIDNSGDITVVDTKISDGFSGIFNQGSLKLSGSTIFDNFSGLKNEGSASILNSTFSDNSVGIFANVNQTDLYADFITVTDNGVGIYSGAKRKAKVRIKNSITADNEILDCEVLDPATIIQAFGANLDTDGSCVDAARGNFTQVTSSQLNLGQLQDNGGPTPTHALNFGSIAVNGTHDDCTTISGKIVATDQRGYLRPGFSLSCDIGAYEFGAFQP